MNRSFKFHYHNIISLSELSADRSSIIGGYFMFIPLRLCVLMHKHFRRIFFCGIPFYDSLPADNFLVFLAEWKRKGFYLSNRDRNLCPKLSALKIQSRLLTSSDHSLIEKTVFTLADLNFKCNRTLVT